MWAEVDTSRWKNVDKVGEEGQRRFATCPSSGFATVLLCLAASCAWPHCHPPCQGDHDCMTIKWTFWPPSVSVSLPSEEE